MRALARVRTRWTVAGTAAATALLLTLGPGTAPARAGTADGTAQAAVGATSLSVSTTFPADRDLETGDVAQIGLSIDADAPTTVRLQQQPAGSTGWPDIAVRPVPAGGSSYVFPVPTAVPGAFALRVVVEAGDPFVSDAVTFTVSGHGPDPQPGPGKRRTTVTLSAHGAAARRPGGRLTVTGRVTGGRSRVVRIQLGTDDGWLRIASGHSHAHGRYRLRVPTGWYYQGRIRAAVPATSRRAAATSASVPVAVRPSYTPRGSAADWSSLMGGRDHWNPCRPVSYAVNTAGAPKQGLAQVKKAFRIVHRATGLRFSYAGSTTAVPYRTDGKGKDVSGADLTVAWGSERAVAPLRGNAVGYGGYSARGSQIVRGTVVLDRGARLAPGFGTGATWGALLLHEIGHAVGLGHATTPSQIMYPMLQRDYRGRYEAGDLAGLRAHGAMAGCFGAGPTYGRVAAPRRVAAE